MKKHTEARLEDAIVDHLTTQGGYVFVDYNHGAAAGRYDRALALDPALLLDFIQATQEKLWKSLHAIHGDETGKVVLDHLAKELETKGMLKVLRQGFKCYGKKLRVAVFAPSNRLNPDTLALYGQNLLSVTRQLYYGETHTKSLDLVLFLNGLPLVTVELKNEMSGQTVEDAKVQYKRHRDHREPLFDFKKRTLVHFAVDPDEVAMTTRLSGDKTHFLPFNLGNQGHAGNPPASDGGYRTAYLWREVWQRDSLLDILGRFMHLQVEEKRILSDEGIKKITKETMIFPRYHQLDAVRRLVAHTQAHGPGRNYLVQHSAGSGKSNSIAWLAHRLSSLHDANDRKIFDSVIVVTDRRILDQQLQNTIYQFEHKQGVVEKIDEDNFRNLYGFLSQVIPYQDSDLERLYTYLRFLLTKLPKREDGGPVHLEDEVELQYYRLQKISEGRIDLSAGEGQPLKGPSDVGTGQEDQTIRLSELIDILNERFGTDFTQADQLFFDQIQEEAIESETLKKAAESNSKDDFRFVFEKAFEGLVIDRMEGNEEIFGKLMSDGEFRKLAVEHLLHKVYNILKSTKNAD